MASNSAESLVINLHKKGAIGFAMSDHPTVIGPPHGFIKREGGQGLPNHVNLRTIASLSFRQPTMTRAEQLLLRDEVIDTYSRIINETAGEAAGPDERYAHILGASHAMTALAAMVAQTRSESVLSLTNDAKPPSISKEIDGDYLRGDTTLGLGGVVRDGASAIKTVEKIRDEGLRLNELVVMVDGQEGGVEALGEEGVKVYSALTIGGITAILLENKRINKKHVDWTAQYFQELIDNKTIGQMPPEIAKLI